MREEEEDPDHVPLGEIDVPGQEVVIEIDEEEIDHLIADDAGKI